MALRPRACSAWTTLALFSKPSMSYTSASTERSTGRSVNCHCQVVPTGGRHTDPAAVGVGVGVGVGVSVAAGLGVAAAVAAGGAVLVGAGEVGGPGAGVGG